MAKKKILLFSPPFSGHLNALKIVMQKYGADIDFHLVITGWTNIAPDLRGVKARVTTLAHSDLHETDPAIWTLPRAAALLGDCLRIAKAENPDIIIYDFFAVEGNFVGKILGIPYWCSIPALMGRWNNQQYLKEKLASAANVAAAHKLQEQFPGLLDVSDIEMISDGLHIPGQKNFIWSYPTLTPKDFMENRKPGSYIFVGHLGASVIYKAAFLGRENPLIYISFGTVVMDNLWNQQIAIREKLKMFVGRLAELLKDEQCHVLFVSRGKPILDLYPENWEVVTDADQIKVLQDAVVFVTHAGGNSFHEAVAAKVPMVAIPFFGDQPLIASQIQKLGLGVNLVPDTEIDTKKSKDFLNESLADEAHIAIKEVLAHKERYRNNFDQLKLEAEDILTFMSN